MLFLPKLGLIRGKGLFMDFMGYVGHDGEKPNKYFRSLPMNYEFYKGDTKFNELNSMYCIQ